MKLAFIGGFWEWEETGREELILIGCPEFGRKSFFKGKGETGP